MRFVCSEHFQDRFLILLKNRFRHLNADPVEAGIQLSEYDLLIHKTLSLRFVFSFIIQPFPPLFRNKGIRLLRIELRGIQRPMLSCYHDPRIFFPLRPDLYPPVRDLRL